MTYLNGDPTQNKKREKNNQEIQIHGELMKKKNLDKYKWEDVIELTLNSDMIMSLWSKQI